MQLVQPGDREGTCQGSSRGQQSCQAHAAPFQETTFYPQRAEARPDQQRGNADQYHQADDIMHGNPRQEWRAWAGTERAARPWRCCASPPRCRHLLAISRAFAANRLNLGDFGAGRVFEFQRGAPYRATLLHPCVAFVEIAHHAAVFELQAVGILEVDRFAPSVIDDIRDLHALGAQLVALVGQGSVRAGLEGKMIEAGGNAEAAVDARIVSCRYVGNVLRFQKGDQLIAPDIEKEVPNAPAFLDSQRVGDDWLEAQDTLVKRAGPIEVKCREANVGKSAIAHGYCSSPDGCSDSFLEIARALGHRTYGARATEEFQRLRMRLRM